SGIGKGIALAMAKEGAHVAIVDINEEKGQETLQELNQHTEGSLFIRDISQEENVAQIVKEVVQQFGKIDILVNNAHASKQAAFVDTTQEMFDLSFDTGIYPTVHFMQQAYPELKKTKGKVINFASGDGMSGQRSEEHTSEIQSRFDLVCRLLLERKTS